MLIRRLHPTLDAEGAVGGVATQASGEQTQEPSTTTTEPKSEQGGADERKPGEEIKSDAQKMADWMLAKRLEGIGTTGKGEVALWSFWNRFWNFGRRPWKKRIQSIGF